MPELDKLELTFIKSYRTKRKTRYDEEVGDQAYSDRDVAIGYIYPYTEAMELIGNPNKIKVTIEPVQ